MPDRLEDTAKDFIVSMNFNFDEVGKPTHGRSTMKTKHWNFAALVLGVVSLCAAPFAAYAFDSGSTGIDGMFDPTVSTQLQLPPDGIFNFTDVNIRAGVTVTFVRNATNTPVTILASGDVTITGALSLSGSLGAAIGASGDGNPGDDGLPGEGGPGGFAGGAGGNTGADPRSGDGLGPGGAVGIAVRFGSSGCGGRGGGYGGVGGSTLILVICGDRVGGGSTYGSATLLPLIGGSGGSGGAGGTSFRGAGGGGGGGAILIAASGTVTVAGAIDANGARGGESSVGSTRGGAGGGGAGGAVRIVASSIAGSGDIRATAGAGGFGNEQAIDGRAGGAGRIRLEPDVSFTFSGSTSPAMSFAAPGDVFVAGFPSLRITSVAGQPAPLEPTGDADITLPSDTPNPVTVIFETSNVPVGNTVSLKVTPPDTAPTTFISDALAGTDDSATASVAVDLPDGPSVLQAQLSFTVTAALGDALRNFAKGERVARIQLAAAPGQGSTTTFISVSGKAYTWPSSAVAMN
jgi:hypothetical protein